MQREFFGDPEKVISLIKNSKGFLLREFATDDFQNYLINSICLLPSTNEDNAEKRGAILKKLKSIQARSEDVMIQQVIDQIESQNP